MVTSLKEVVLTGLPPLTQVSVSVAAATLAGIGPAGRTVFQTLEGGRSLRTAFVVVGVGQGWGGDGEGQG